MRLLVCGSRNWDDAAELVAALDAIAAVFRVETVIEGESRGADRMARTWAIRRGIPVEAYPADWKRLGRSAGAQRNQRMLVEGRPDLIVAFPIGASVGTRHMMEIGRRNGVRVLVYPDDMATVHALGEGVFA